MAAQFSWMRDAYDSVVAWGKDLPKSQVNPDRGAYIDALVTSTASKYVDSEINKDLFGFAADKQTKLMEADRDNTKDLMATEQKFKLEGMGESNRLSKDFLGAQTESDIVKTRVGGQEQRELVRTTAEEQRRSLDHNRQTAFTLARSGLRRA
jgi:hypothetical protein